MKFLLTTQPNKFSRFFSIFLAIFLFLTMSSQAFAQIPADQRLNYESGREYLDTVTCDASASDVSLSGEDNAEKIYNFLIGQDFSPEQAAGFLGNFFVESGFDPGITEIGGGGGYGLAQWTAGRRTDLENYAKSQGEKVDDLGLQLKFIMFELRGKESAAFSSIKATKSVGDAWLTVSLDYERPAEPENPLRGSKAQEYFDKFSGNTTGGSSGLVSNNSGGASGCGSNANGIVNADGYALPVDRDVVAGQLPCQSATCHHDGTPAADLGIADKWEGKPVYAIFDGKISNLHYRAGLVGGPAPQECISLQLEGADGWTYWYGHIKNPTIKNGDSVKAGQKLAVIGQAACADTTPPHLHIDRGSPKGRLGGSECCRDPGFIPLLNKIYQDGNTNVNSKKKGILR